MLDGEGWEPVEVVEPFYNPFKPAPGTKISIPELNRVSSTHNLILAFTLFQNLEKAKDELHPDLFDYEWMKLMVPIELTRNPTSTKNLIISKPERKALKKEAEKNLAEYEKLAEGKTNHQAKFVKIPS